MLSDEVRFIVYNHSPWKKMSNVATRDSLILRSYGGNANDNMNTKFFPFKNLEGKVIKRGSTDVHHVVTLLFLWSREKII